MQPRVKAANYKTEYKIELVFTNDEVREIDVAPYLDFGVFKKLKDVNAFKRVKVSFGTIEWDCGVDLDPEFVWQKSTPK